MGIIRFELKIEIYEFNSRKGLLVIALLFALFAGTMVLAYFKLVRISYALFVLTLLASAYWLKFHATTPLTIQL